MGLVGAGNIGIKSQKERRYVCKTCGHSFAETTGTPLFALKKPQALFRQEATLSAGMYLVGTFYNFCSVHDSLRQEQPIGRRKWRELTPAMAAGITDHAWSSLELLTYPIAPPPHVAPKRRGRKPKQACSPAMVAA
jgi:hypothetical protein